MRRLSPLIVDLYELTMAEAYLRHGPDSLATFDLFVRDLPPERPFLLAVGLGTVLEQIEGLRFDDDDLADLAEATALGADTLEYLASLRFSGDVWAVPEGTPIFPGEPLLRITAPIVEAQLLETMVMNLVHVQTLLATKAARVVLAAQGRPVVDFGMRRAHGPDAAMLGARAFWIAGIAATSNVAAGRELGIPTAGTMAHSFIQAWGNEEGAFRAFVETWPETVLLVDTYDTLRGIERVIDLARELGPAFKVRGIRLDSGDLDELAAAARARLDDAGLHSVQIFASGNLDEHRIAELVAAGAPIDAFGVGTRLATSADDPNLNIVYKLAQLDDRPLLKLSTDKTTLPGIKQIWRRRGGDGIVEGDIIGVADEILEGEALLVEVMRSGVILEAGRPDLAMAREHAREQLASLPEQLRRLQPVRDRYPVEISPRLRRMRDEAAARLSG